MKFTVILCLLLMMDCGRPVVSAGIQESAARPGAGKEADGKIPQPAQIRRRALLIGCSRYDHLKPKYQLRGPLNDVRLIRELLLSDRFGLDPDSVRVLAEGEGPDRRPTCSSILAAFQELIGQSGPGDQVLILMAGHGSQQPDAGSDPGDPEPDGLDEVFLPADVPYWTAGQPFENAIADDMIRDLIGKLEAKGAGVFFVADTCHSGSLDRGLYDGREYDRPRALLPDETSGSRSAVAGRSGGVAEPDGSQLDTGGGSVALYAVPADSIELEGRMPPDQRVAGSPVHGRLCYALATVLNRSDSALSYRELEACLQRQYDDWNWTPKPYVSGHGPERHVLGQSVWSPRSLVLMRSMPDGTLRLDAGTIHGFGIGTVFSVCSQGQEFSGDAIGHVQIVEAGLAGSRVVPCSFGGRAERPLAEFPGWSRCVPVRLDPAAKTARVAVVEGRFANPEGGGEKRQQVAGELEKELLNPGWLATYSPDPQLASCFVVVNETGPELWNGDQVRPGSGPLAVYAWDEDWKSRILSDILRIVRAGNLLDLAESPVGHSPPEPGAPPLAKAVLEHRPESGGDFRPLSEHGSAEVRDGDQLRLTVTTESGLPVDLNLFYVESGFRIIAVAPQQGWRQITRNNPAVYTMKLNDSTLGRENIVLIASANRSPDSSPLDLDFLAQDGLQRWPVERGSGDGSAVGSLVEKSLFGGTGSRGLERSPADPFFIRRWSWTVVR